MNWSHTPFQTIEKAASVLYTLLNYEYQRERQDNIIKIHQGSVSSELKEIRQRIASSDQQIVDLSASVLDVVEEANAVGQQDIVQTLIPGQTYIAEKTKVAKHFLHLPREAQIAFLKSQIERALPNLRLSDDQARLFMSLGEKESLSLQHVFPVNTTTRFNIKLRPFKASVSLTAETSSSSDMAE
jgi:hypothetical protein